MATSGPMVKLVDITSNLTIIGWERSHKSVYDDDKKKNRLCVCVIRGVDDGGHTQQRGEISTRQ